MIFRNKNKIKYSLAPQTKFYDSMAAKWKPFVMFNQYPNIRSEFCNTDKYGLRFNKVTKKNLKNLQYLNNTISIKKIRQLS